MARPGSTRFSNGLLLLVLLTMVLTQAFPTGANHAPADKMIASASKIVIAGPGAEVTILRGTLRTSSPSDLLLSLSMECSIFTRLVTGPGERGESDSATARGRIVAWVEIDGKIVPINSSSQPGNAAPPAGDESDKVTYCDRTYSRTVTDAEDPLDGQDIEDDFIDTKSANSYHWIRVNLGNGIHQVVVKATLSETTTGDATAEAWIGNRVVVVQPQKMANDASI